MNTATTEAQRTSSSSSATATATAAATDHPVVSADRWLAERQALLAREKELVRLGDEIARARRALPWEQVEKDYVFDAPEGRRSLADLFDGRSQLIVQHFMFGPGWQQGCPSCSYMADHTDGMTVHLRQRDVSFVAVSRASIAEIERFRARMGWQFRWVSSAANDFNKDFHVSFDPEDRIEDAVYYNYRMNPFPNTEAPGISVFHRNDAGEIFHTYSTFERGVEAMMGTYRMLDLVPRGRDEHDGFYKMDWVRHHDRYEARAAKPAPVAGACCHGQA
ncbi:MAG TPA: DUF899 domain-containing protein [Caldimonas sp.]|jgi:predicted dithiol-disulfide oxidoreductase (DUF899 family)|nr:DUF899 domain-containing protein [Caldimonas sp.]HEX2542905.1 DUF899 domain-containing protein [Caldimonas sp.]